MEEKTSMLYYDTVKVGSDKMINNDFGDVSMHSLIHEDLLVIRSTKKKP